MHRLDTVCAPDDLRAADDQFVFTRHDRAGRKADKGISAGSGWEIVRGRAREALDTDAVELIHPHVFRHYFITIAILATNNIEKARRLARHKSITTTQLYAELDDELDRDYDDIFNQRQKKKTGSAQ